MEKLLVFAKADDTCERYLYAAEYMGFEPAKAYAGSDPGDFAGVMIIGGADIDPAFYGEDNTDSRGVDRDHDIACFAMIRRSVELGVPVLGICRGLQLINVFFGGSLFQNIPNHLMEGGMHEVFGLRENSLRYGFPERMLTNSRHHQAVKKLGSGLVVSARADDGTVEAIEHASGKVLAVQWHPERMLGNMPGEGEDGSIVFDIYKKMINAS